MSELKRQLQTALKDAMRAKDRQRRDAIRLLNSAIKQVEIDSRSPLDDAGVMQVLQREAKKHRETIAELESADRSDDAGDARYELSVVEAFLPQPLDDAELRRIVEAAVAQTGANSMKDMGKVMGAVMPSVRGRADGKRVSALVRACLSQDHE